MNAAFDRIAEATGAKTQVELADILEIRQSSISDAKRRNSVPDAWLVALLKKFSLNPDWILTGQGCKYMAPSDRPHFVITHKQEGKNMFLLPEGQHRFTDIQVLDEPGAGGAHHEYRIVRRQPEPIGQDSTAPVFSTVSFQKGPVNEEGVNGIFMEDLLEVCRHRLQCFQAGNFACRENELALTKLEEAIHWLNHRTTDRQRRKVEGTSQQ